MRQPPALILVGASGVGKNTVAEILLGIEGSPFSYSRSLTTRDPRSTFTDEYLYVSAEEFLSRVESKSMLEYTYYGDHYYGTPASEPQRVRAEGKIPLLILDINGVESIRRDSPDFPIYAVYLYAEPEVILRRLYARDMGSGGEESRARIEQRLKNNRADFDSLAKGRYRLFDAFVENLTAEEAAAHVLELYQKNAHFSETSMLAMRDFFARAAKFEF